MCLLAGGGGVTLCFTEPFDEGIVLRDSCCLAPTGFEFEYWDYSQVLHTLLEWTLTVT